MSGQVTRESEHERGVKAAEEVARWKLGDRGWAHTILNAYFNPGEAIEKLREEEDR